MEDRMRIPQPAFHQHLHILYKPSMCLLLKKGNHSSYVLKEPCLFNCVFFQLCEASVRQALPGSACQGQEQGSHGRFCLPVGRQD